MPSTVPGAWDCDFCEENQVPAFTELPVLGGDRQGMLSITCLVVNTLWKEEGGTGTGIRCRGWHSLSCCGACVSHVVSVEQEARGHGDRALAEAPGARRHLLRVEGSHCGVSDRGMFPLRVNVEMIDREMNDSCWTSTGCCLFH